MSEEIQVYHPCWICGSPGPCRHREREVEAAILAREIFLYSRLSSLRKPVEKAGASVAPVVVRKAGSGR